MGSVSDRDNGYARLIASLSDKDIQITVGVHAEEGPQVEVAERHEFGLGVPARPFVSGWADEHAADLPARIAAEAETAVRAKFPVAQRMDQLAQVFAGEVQARISGGIQPPNSPVTIERKGSSTPLIDKGQLRASIRGKVRAK